MLNPKRDNLENRFLKPEYPFKLNTSLFLLSIMDQCHIDAKYVLFDISAGPSLPGGAVSSDDEDAYCPPLPPGLPAAPTAPAAVTAHQQHQDNQAHGE